MFRKLEEDEAEVILVACVDDMLVSTHGQAGNAQFITDTSKHFRMKDLGETSYYLRFCNRYERLLILNQYLYVETIAERSEVMKTGMAPELAGSAPVSKKNGP